MKEPGGFPELGSSVPKRGGSLIRGVGRLVLRVFGWSFGGELPDLGKAVLIVAPHTSNWDFVLGVTAMFALGLRVSWLGKHTVFRRPFGWFFRWLGGIAVDRTTSTGVVEQMVETFRTRDELILGLAPEGTRRPVTSWKTGFYHIAVGAEVPIVPVSFDYARRVIRLGAPLVPTGDLSADMERIQEVLRGRGEEVVAAQMPKA